MLEEPQEQASKTSALLDLEYKLRAITSIYNNYIEAIQKLEQKLNFLIDGLIEGQFENSDLVDPQSIYESIIRDAQIIMKKMESHNHLVANIEIIPEDLIDEVDKRNIHQYLNDRFTEIRRMAATLITCTENARNHSEALSDTSKSKEERREMSYNPEYFMRLSSGSQYSNTSEYYMNPITKRSDKRLFTNKYGEVSEKTRILIAAIQKFKEFLRESKSNIDTIQRTFGIGGMNSKTDERYTSIIRERCRVIKENLMRKERVEQRQEESFPSLQDYDCRGDFSEELTPSTNIETTTEQETKENGTTKSSKELGEATRRGPNGTPLTKKGSRKM